MDRRGMIGAMLAAGVADPAVGRTARGARQPDPALLAAPAGVAVSDGYAAGPNGRVFYRRFGDGDETPVVTLHGGPAGAHGYMMPYAHIARDRPTVLYDQTGCGRSDAPADLSRYTVATYVAELEALRVHIGAERMILLGHSWGGMLAPAYAAAHPTRVAAIVLAGTAAMWSDFSAAAERWLAELGPPAVATVRRAEATGKLDDPAYVALTERYYALHLCRLAPWPQMLADAGAAIGGNPVYTYLNGPTEFQFTGALSGYDGSAAARAIRVPTLVTCGEYDEAPPWIGRKLAALIPGARFQAFAGLSHMAHIEDPATVVGATRRFVGDIA